jgi:IS5 family transposase
LLGAAHLAGKIDWQNASVDGSFAAGKGYDSQELRKKIRARGIQPKIPRRKWPKRKHGKENGAIGTVFFLQAFVCCG